MNYVHCCNALVYELLLIISGSVDLWIKIYFLFERTKVEKRELISKWIFKSIGMMKKSIN